VVLLFEIFADDEDGSAFKDLEVILDRTTPLYKHRMDDLSDQQQAIVEAIALNWDALSVKEIAERTRLESKIISAQLQNLEKNGIVEKISTKTKNHLYIVAERFFNIWYLMRNGRRGDEKRVLWLVQFFEDWCDGDMMKVRAAQHRDALEKGDFNPKAALTYTQAITYLTLLLAKNEHQWLYDYFTSPEGEAAQLKDRFKPIWYAILKQLDHPDFLRMGEELAQTVEEVLAKAKQMAVDYA
jgi:Bacterial regulatory protein, arsR family